MRNSLRGYISTKRVVKYPVQISLTQIVETAFRSQLELKRQTCTFAAAKTTGNKQRALTIAIG